LWLEIRLAGKVWKAWNRLTTEDRYDHNSVALLFDDTLSQRADEISTLTHGRMPNESWGEIANNLWGLADKVFLDLKGEANLTAKEVR